MITWRGERVVQLAKMNLPGDIRHRAMLPHVVQMAKEMRHGLTPLPAIRKGAKGKWAPVTENDKDIVAAHVAAQWPELRGREVSCTDLDARLMCLTEQRRGERDEFKAEALSAEVERVEADILANPKHPPTAVRGRRRSTTSEAVRQVAKAAGLDERSLLRAYRRRAGVDDQTEPVMPAGPMILDLGMPLSRDFLDKVCAVQGAVTAALDGVTRVKRAMQKLDALPYPKHAIVLADLDELSERLRKYWPFSLCPYCKGLSGVQEGCAACSMQGWLGEGQIDGVPDKLWDKVDRVVMVGGEAKRVADLLPLTELL